MKRPSYGERDYAFGQRMLNLRTDIGLTQAGLADQLGVSRRAVSEWEAGKTYPKVQHLKALLELAVRTSAFAAGREEEEIRALWKAAHQKVLLDESWLFSLLKQSSSLPALVLVEESAGALVGSAPTPALIDEASASVPGASPPSSEPFAGSASAGSGPRVDWGEALEVPSFYGREGELTTLSQWIVQDSCRVVSVLGMGGIGKSALVTSAMRQAASNFQIVLFRSLRDAPSCEALLEALLQQLASQPLDVSTADLDRRLNLLLEHLRQQRVLLVLDNLETLLQEGDVRGHLRPGYEDYTRLLQTAAQRGHQSCLLLTSREKPGELRALEGRNTLVRSLRLTGLDGAAGEQLLVSHELLGSPEEQTRLVERYEGNPLALHIVAQTIADLFGGQIAPFLAQDTLVFGSIRDLLDEQWGRLSALEQTLLYWLAILREPVTLQELQAALVAPLVPMQVLEALDGLQRRSLVERGQRPGSFTLQSVVLEFVSERLVSMACQEIVQGRLSLLIEHALSQAQASDYVRQTQRRLLVAPLLAQLYHHYQGQGEIENCLLALLSQLRERADHAQGYGPANVLALLREQRGHLRDLDLSRLVLRGVHLQGVEMQDANLAGALMRECVWTESFEAITAVAVSSNGQYWAAASGRGEVRVWQVGRGQGQTLHLVWRPHTDYVWMLAFSPDNRLLASGGQDGRVKLWDVESGAMLWSGEHAGTGGCLTFSPDGSLLASGGYQGTVRLWDPKLGTLLDEMSHPTAVMVLNFSPDGHLLACGDDAGTIRLWEVGQEGSHPATCVQTLAGHSSRVMGLVFVPDGSLLASGGWDASVKLWDVGEEGSLHLRQTLLGHTQPVNHLALSPDGALLASASFDHTIRLWDAKLGTLRLVLQGHTAVVYRVAFTPDGRVLSGSEDGTLRLWDVERGQCLRVLQGYETCLYDLDWSPDGTQLVSAGSNTEVTVWEVESGKPPRVLHGHEWSVYGVAWSPDGSMFATSGFDNAVRLWDPTTGRCLHVIRDLDHPGTIIFGVAVSPDGKRLAAGTFMQGVLMWDVSTRTLQWSARTDSPRFIRLAWHPDGTRLAAGGEDAYVSVWDASDGRMLLRLAGHQGVVISVAFSPDGTQLASGGDSKDGGELMVWDARSGERMYALQRLTGTVNALAWHPVGKQLISGGSDGRLCWWDLPSGECVRVQEAHQGTVQALKVSPDGSRLASCGEDGAIHIWDIESGEHVRTLRRDRPYERLNISGIQGLTEAQKDTLRALGAIEATTVPASQQAP